MSNSTIGPAGQFISLEKAIEMTTRYRANQSSIIKPEYAGQELIALSDKIDRNILDTLLGKPGCAAIRIYYGMNSDLKVHPVLVAVNERDEDILPASDLGSTLDGDNIADDTLRCPPYCPPPSPLNS